MRPHRRVVAALMALACAATQSSSRATPEPPPPVVDERALGEALVVDGADCIDTTSLAAALATIRGKSTVDARVRVVLRETVVEGGRRVGFSVLRDARPVGERVLDRVDGACHEALAAVALVVSIALDDAIAGVAAPSPERPPPRPEPPIVVPLPPANRPSSAPAPAPRPEAAAFGPHVEALVLGGLLPRVAPGLAISGNATFPRMLEARLGIVGALSSSAPFGGGRVTASLVLGRLDGCIRTGASLVVRGCVGLALGRFAAVGDGFVRSLDGQQVWAAPMIRVDARHSIGRFYLSLALDLAVPLVRPKLEALGADGRVLAASTSPPAGFAVGLGGGYAFH